MEDGFPMSIHPLHPKDQPHMTGTTWERRLDTSYSVREVINVSRDFLASFGPLELQSLPAPCRPPEKLYDADQLGAFAFELVRHECNASDGTSDLTHRLARFFSHASIRISQIRAHEAAKDGDYEEQQSA